MDNNLNKEQVKSENSSPKEVFLHLLAIISLYMSVGGLMALLFQYINIYFPDRLDYYSYQSIADLIRYSMASLIIIFPVYMFVSYMIRKDYILSPEKLNLKIRKWLLYFTLFAASVTVIIDLITLIYNFLGGDLTARFVFKILVVLIIACLVFWYYLRELKNKLTSSQIYALTWIVSLVVVISIITGFFTAGSPLKARLWKFDQDRINNLQSIQDQVVYFWQQKNKLPTALSDLNNNISGYIVPIDPENSAAYEYQVVDKLSFKLCANFNLATSEEFIGPSRAMQEYDFNGFYKKWEHGAGKACFDRNIDSDLNNPKNPIPLKFTP